jgi:hypothetical protein
MDDLYPAIEHEVMGLVDAVQKYRMEDNLDPEYWQPVAELPMPYLEGVVQKCPRWRFALERLLETALAQWPRPSNHNLVNNYTPSRTRRIGAQTGRATLIDDLG